MRHLRNNPLVLTYHRLAVRWGLPYYMVLLFVCGCGYAVYVYTVLTARMGRGGVRGDDEDVWFYLGLLGVEAAAVSLTWLATVGAKIAQERKDGLLESNWLTPMSPARVAWGYLLGPPAATFYIFVVGSVIGFAIARLVELPIWFWAATQLLVGATGFLAGLVGLVFGLIGKSPNNAGGVGFILFWGTLAPIAAGTLCLMNFVVPIVILCQLLDAAGIPDLPQRMTGDPDFFGLKVPALLFTPVAYASACAWLWAMARRKIVDPKQPELTPRMALSLYACILVAQHGLLWHMTDGLLPQLTTRLNADALAAMAILHGVALLLGLLLIPRVFDVDRVRYDTLAGKPFTRISIFRYSNLPVAARMAAIGTIALLTQCYNTVAGGNPWFLLMAANFLCAFILPTLIVESLTRRLGKAVLPLGIVLTLVIYLLPLGFFIFPRSYHPYAWLSPFVSGTAATGNPTTEMVTRAWIATGVHGGLIVAFGALWVHAWKRMRSRAQYEAMGIDVEPRPSRI